jgi:hypothetical protein
MAYLGTKRALGMKMLGHKKPMGNKMLGYRMPGAEAPVEVMTKGLEQSKKQGGLERVRRNGGWNSLGNYAGG